MSNEKTVIVLTGGPCGGKTTLIEELKSDSLWTKKFVAVPEAISVMHYLNISPSEKIFQKVMVNLQLSFEDGLKRAFESEDEKIIICHRGSLDPLAYWLYHGWDEAEFFNFALTKKEEHYKRYKVVIHLITAADGVPEVYKKWPEAHRSEDIKEAIHIDKLLQKVWSEHPNYFLVDNSKKGWEAKSKIIKNILYRVLDIL
jgi:predicted ATPase